MEAWNGAKRTVEPQAEAPQAEAPQAEAGQAGRGRQRGACYSRYP